ncbi:MAG: Mrp/NBP35 family ATP-binding protein [Thermodesulfobacteriota bacterium]
MSTCSSKGCASKGSSCGSPKAAQAMQDLAITASLGRIRHKILVMSGKGGVGKSTVATNLALALARRGHQVGLMDVDLHGPDVCRMLGLAESLQEAPAGGLLPAMRAGDNLKVISLEYLMRDRDEAIIWRGPLKMQAIRQFISDVDWGELDYLVIDAPPGTGDEPLTVAQLMKDGHALIVTTPQEVALADVRKSINFCRHVALDVLGLVENMSGFVCPHCRETVEIFKKGGGEETAAAFDLPFLGRIPLDPLVVTGGDDGQPYLASQPDSVTGQAFDRVVSAVETILPPRRPAAAGAAA